MQILRLPRVNMMSYYYLLYKSADYTDRDQKDSLLPWKIYCNSNSCCTSYRSSSRGNRWSTTTTYYCRPRLKNWHNNGERGLFPVLGTHLTSDRRIQFIRSFLIPVSSTFFLFWWWWRYTRGLVACGWHVPASKCCVSPSLTTIEYSSGIYRYRHGWLSTGWELFLEKKTHHFSGCHFLVSYTTATSYYYVLLANSSILTAAQQQYCSVRVRVVVLSKISYTPIKMLR